MTEEKEDQVDAVSELDDNEQKQFAEWLDKQDPSRRKQYLKLAQAYGFPEDSAE